MSKKIGQIVKRMERYEGKRHEKNLIKSNGIFKLLLVYVSEKFNTAAILGPGHNYFP